MLQVLLKPVLFKIVQPVPTVDPLRCATPDFVDPDTILMEMRVIGMLVVGTIDDMLAPPSGSPYLQN